MNLLLRSSSQIVNPLDARRRFGFGSGVTGAEFSPLVLSPLVWFDARQETLSNGAALSTITDFSGNARHLTQATAANQGVFNTTGLNSRQEFQFDGVNDVCARTDAGGYTLNGPLTMWVVGRMRGLTTARTPFFSIGQNASASNYLTIEANTFLTAGSKYGLYVTNNTLDSAQATSSSAFIIILCISSATAGTNVATVTDYKFNGTSQVLTLKSGSGALASMTGMDRMALGGFAGSTSYGNCGIGEAGMVNGDIGSANAAALYTYLSAKWGI